MRFVINIAHLCQKPNIEMDKLGCFGLGLVRSPQKTKLIQC